MKLNIFLLLVGISCFIVSNGYAQKNKKVKASEYIIKTNGDTIKGKIGFDFTFLFIRTVILKTDDGKKEWYTPEQVTSFFTYESKEPQYWISAKVPDEKEKIFLQYLIKGKMNFFTTSFRSSSVGMVMANPSASSGVTITNASNNERRYFSSDSKVFTEVTRTTFREAKETIFTGCPELNEQFSRHKFRNVGDMPEMILFYNQNCSR